MFDFGLLTPKIKNNRCYEEGIKDKEITHRFEVTIDAYFSLKYL